MPYPPLKTRLSKFRNDECGSVSVEFSIILTAIMLVVVMFVSLAIHIATTSEVQQAAHDLTRQSLKYIDLGLEPEAVCAWLQADMIEKVTGQLTFIDPAQVQSLTCQIDDGRTLGRVTLSYSIDGSFLDRAVQVFGVELKQIERSAQIVL